MRTPTFAAAFFPVVLTASLLVAQETPEFPGPQKEHEWLKQFVGEWETEAQSVAGPDMPAMTCKGTMSSRMLGGFWVISESEADLQGTTINAVQTIGYDPQTKKYVGTWVDSMMNHLWKYEGTVDETGKILTLQAEGPSFVAAGKTAKYRDVYEFKSPDEIVTTSQMQGDDGQWIAFMTGLAKRKK
jgi:hypothetical protein